MRTHDLRRCAPEIDWRELMLTLTCGCGHRLLEGDGVLLPITAAGVRYEVRFRATATDVVIRFDPRTWREVMDQDDADVRRVSGGAA